MRLTESDWRYVDERATGFTGRTWVFERVRSFLAGPERLLLICGPPGIGKTAVASRLTQASAGRISIVGGTSIVASDSFDGAVFCRAGSTDLLEVAQQLSDQLAEAMPEFARERTAIAAGISIDDVRVSTGDVAEGAQVAGVRIVLDRLGPEKAFSQAVALPLRRLADGASQPGVLLVDALDEAFAAPTARELPRLLAELTGVKIVATARDDRRVSAQLGESVVKVHLLDDAPPGRNDVLEFLSGRFRGLGPDDGMDELARRLAGEAEGNFLYCVYVANEIIRSGVLAQLDSQAAKRIPLPRGGLAGVYREFLRRELTRDENSWSERFRPILAPLAVVFGDGMTTSQLALVATRIAGRKISRSAVGDVIRIAGQFLDGPLPDGPYRPYHQSFAEFLTDTAQNPDWPVDEAETHAAVVAALVDYVPRNESGSALWEKADAYTRVHLSAHAARAGILDNLLVDPAYLLVAYPPALLDVLGGAGSREARRAAAAYRRVAHRFWDRAEPSRASYLRLAAIQYGAEPLVNHTDHATADSRASPRWWPVWNWWRPAVPSYVLTRLPAVANGVAAISSDDGPLVVVGGTFGLQVWEMRSMQCLASHPWKVLTLAVGYAGRRPVVLAGHSDGGVALHELPSLVVVAHDDVTHSGKVLAAAIGKESFAVTGDSDGTLVLWQLSSLERIAIRSKAHTMVRDVATTDLAGAPLIISAGDTLRSDGFPDMDVATVRAWRLPKLDLLTEIETGSNLAEVVAAVACPFGSVVLAQGGLRVRASLIAADTETTPIGEFEPGGPVNGFVVLQEGSKPEVLVCTGGLTHVQIRLDEGSHALTVLRTLVDAVVGWPASWTGPIQIDRRVLVSAASEVRVWDLDDILGTAAEQHNAPYLPLEHAVEALAVADELLAVVTTTGIVHRWRWRTGEALEPITVSAERIRALVSCQLGGTEHFVVASADGAFVAFDAESGDPWHARIHARANLRAAAVGRHRGKVIMAAAVELHQARNTFTDGYVYGVRLWDLETGEEIQTRSAGVLDVMRRKRQLGIRAGHDEAMTDPGWEDKPLDPIVAVEAAGDLFIAARNSRGVRIWPLSSIEAPIDIENDRIRALSGGGAGLAVAEHGGRLELWRLHDGLDRTYGGNHPSVSAVAIVSRRDETVLLSGGGDGFLRIWSSAGGEVLSIELGEPISAVAALGGDHVAVATSRGVLVLRLPDVASAPDGQLHKQLGALRIAVRSERGADWNWNYEEFIFPVDAPQLHSGPAAAVAELVLVAPAASFRGLSRWLEDNTQLTGGGRTVADVACGLMMLYAHLAFDELTDILADAWTAAGAESSKPWQVLKKILVGSPTNAAVVCERWSCAGPSRAQLASAAANWVLQMPMVQLSQVRARLLATQQRILDRDPTPVARTEALHSLFSSTESRARVMTEMLDRFRGKIDGYASPSMVADALGTHFDIVCDAFMRRLMHTPQRYDGAVLSALAKYTPASDIEAAAIMTVFERLWDAGPGEPLVALEESLLTFAAHAPSCLDRAVALAVTVASVGDRVARRELADEIVRGSNSTLRRQLLDRVAEADNRELKEALIANHARTVIFGTPDPTMFELIFHVGGSELEAQSFALMLAAKKSAVFAAALARTLKQTTPNQDGLLEMFAERIAAGAKPKRAATEIYDIHMRTLRQARGD